MAYHWRASENRLLKQMELSDKIIGEIKNRE